MLDVVLQLDGLADHQVLQRSDDGTARVAVPTDWSPPIDVPGRTEGGVLALPTGGPYRIRTGSGRVVDDLHVGDVWLLAGQSNMVGAGALDGHAEAMDGVRLFGIDERWQPAVDPLHRLWSRRDNPLLRVLRHVLDEALDDDAWAERCDPTHRQDEVSPVGGVGPGSAFAQAMVAATGVPIGVVPCAIGSTSLDQWDKGFAARRGVPSSESLYGNLLRRAVAVGGVRGILWYQGEGDTGSAAAPTYLERFSRFVADLRDDLGDPQLPFLTVQLGRYDAEMLSSHHGIPPGTHDVTGWHQVREAQRLAALRVPAVGVVVAADCALGDGIHLDRAGNDRVGVRLAQLALGRSTPTLSSVRTTPAGREVRCRFASVEAGLVVPPTVTIEVGPSPIGVTSIRPDGDDLVVTTDRPVPASSTITYGAGVDPTVGITDGAGSPVPLFGPVPIEWPTQSTDVV